MGDVLRDLFVRLGVVVRPTTKKELREFDKQIEGVKDHLENAAGFALRVGTAVASMAVAGALALGKLAVSTGQHSTEIERQARALNLTREEYQELQHVFDTFGADAGEIADVFQQINDKAVEAQAGSKSAVDEFKLLGISVDKLKGKRPHELFELIADASANAADKSKAMAGVSKLLGEDSAKKLAPALAQGAAAIRAMRLEAHELGLVLNDEQLAASKRVAGQWQRLTNVAKGIRIELGAALAPVVERVLNGILDWVKANRALISQRIESWVARLDAALRLLDAAVRLIGGWDVAIAAVAGGAGILLLLTNLKKILETVEALKVAFMLLRGVAASAGLAIGAPFIPVAIVIAGLAGLLFALGLVVDDVVTHFRGGQSVLGGWLDIIDSIIPAFGAWRDMWWALATAIGTGWVEIGRFIGALVKGLAPALQLVDMAIQPVLWALSQLLALWQHLNMVAATPMRGWTAMLNAVSAQSDVNSKVLAGQLQQRVSTSVQAQVNGLRMAPTTGAQTNVSMNPSMTINGGTQMSRSDVDQFWASEMRKAGHAVLGGKR